MLFGGESKTPVVESTIIPVEAEEYDRSDYIHESRKDRPHKDSLHSDVEEDRARMLGYPQFKVWQKNM